MSTNKHKPHILVLPEDDANRQIANGFVLDPSLNGRVIQILPPVGGWKKVVDNFRDVHLLEMKAYPERRIVLLIDFDQKHEKRLNCVKEMSSGLLDRVFVLGALSEPEDLKKNIGKNFEDIGKALSQDCVDNTRRVWGHELLKHNEAELDRMIVSVKPFLFNRPV
ncbi:MAG: hypothetical protein WAW37_15965 [Syntrophobacteraceae bacterium]